MENETRVVNKWEDSKENSTHEISSSVAWVICGLILISIVALLLIGRYVIPAQHSLPPDKFIEDYQKGYFAALEPVKQSNSFSVYPGTINIDIAHDMNVLTTSKFAITNHYGEARNFRVKVLDRSTVMFFSEKHIEAGKASWIYAFSSEYRVDALDKRVVGFFVLADDIPKGEWYCSLLVYCTDPGYTTVQYEVLILISRH